MNNYYKYQALGNDYLVLDPKSFIYPLNEQRINRICHRNFGIGSDGILYGPEFRSDGTPHVTIYNPDGSEAEKSGNGVRIFSKYLYDQSYIKENSFLLNTKGGVVSVTRNNFSDFTVSMGVLSTAGNKEIEIEGKKYRLHLASIGNPHAVSMLDEISENLARKIGPVVENHEFFPNRTNVQLAQISDRKNINAQIWERGAGYTLASGSSSCAIVGVCYRLELCDEEVKVHMPGGDLEITVNKQFEMTMKGEVSNVAKGEFATQFMDELLYL